MPVQRIALLAALTALALPAAAGASSAPAGSTYCGPVAARTVVIVIHGGGYALGSPADTQRVCTLLGARGFRVVNLSYPLYDLTGAIDTMHRAANTLRSQGHRVWAYGESAGGGLAALAAARGWVSRAYAWAPVSDLPDWQRESLPGFVHWEGFKNTSRPELRWASARTFAGRSSSPILVEHGAVDVHVPTIQSVQLAHRWPAMHLRLVAGGHLPDSLGYVQAPQHALAYFLAHR